MEKIRSLFVISRTENATLARRGVSRKCTDC